MRSKVGAFLFSLAIMVTIAALPLRAEAAGSEVQRGPVLVQFDFAYQGPFGKDMTAAMTGLAQSIAQEPGFIWKIWTENDRTREAGGIYLFKDEQSARAYIAKHSARLKAFGIDKVNAKVFDVNVPLTGITRGTLAAR
jgi:hypothetical protein